MKRAYVLLLGIGMASSALAQHEGHDGPAAAPAAETPPADATAAPDAGQTAATTDDPHAGHVMNAEPAVAADPHAGHTMPAPAISSAPAAHDMGTMDAGGAAARDQAPPAAAFEGPDYAADLFYDSSDMARARAVVIGEHGKFRGLFLMADRFEMQRRDGQDVYLWDAQGWYGGDIDKFWFKTEGTGEFDTSPGEFELQTLWSHAIHPWFDFQAGARWDFASGFERSQFVVGIQGLVPYQFEVDAAAFISDEGDISARFEGEYDVWLTQRLILQPRVEAELMAQDIPELALGSGLSSGEIGTRLHYQFAREFAPYVGVEYERLFGGTEDAARRAGNDAGGWNVVLGLRSWF